MRESVAEALGEIGDPRAVEQIMKLLKSRIASLFDAVSMELGIHSESTVYEKSLQKLSVNVRMLGTNICKAYNNGRCVVRSRDTGPYKWDPNNWQSCNVVRENRKLIPYDNFWE